MISSLILYCPNKHQSLVCMFQKGVMPVAGIMHCLTVGQQTGEFSDVCIECGQRAEEWREVSTKLSTWEDLPRAEFPESIWADLKRPNTCLILIRKTIERAEVKTLVVHMVPGHGGKN